MTPALGFALPLLAPVLTIVAAAAAAFRSSRVLAAPLLALALACDFVLSVTAAALNAELGTNEQVLFTWSPLGLYGEVFAVRRGPDAALLAGPVLFLAWLGVALADRHRRWFSGRVDDSPVTRIGLSGALAAIGGAVWSVRAGDFVSLYSGIALFLGGSVLVLGTVAGASAAGRRAVLSYLCGVGLLASALILGRVNGHFQLSGLSTSGFGGSAFFGLALVAAFAAAVPPFHGWLLRSARHPIAPALAAGGTAGAAALLLVAFRTVDLGTAWQAQLRAAGWIAALVGSGVALTRRRPAVALAAAAVARAGALFLAASVATPAALGGALLLFLFSTAPLGFLWLTAAHPWGGHFRSRGPVTPTLRSPGFWVNVIVLAAAAGLPPTVGGLARTALTAALTAWPSGDQLLRLPVFLADLAALAAGGALLWDPRFLAPLRGRWGWAAVAGLGAVLCGPVVLPAYVVAPWLGPSTAAAVGTASSPLKIDSTVFPPLPSLALAAIGAWILVQRLRGREWLPPLGTAAVGAAALGWTELRRRWRRRGLGRAPAALAGAVWLRFQLTAARALLLLRPLEERYYAGAAILLAVAIIFVIGR